MESIRNSNPSVGQAAQSAGRLESSGASVRPRHILFGAGIALGAFVASLLLPGAKQSAPDPLRPQSKLATQRIRVGEHDASSQALRASQQTARRSMAHMSEEVTAP